ncbi:MAG: double-strand break repair protein AddB [Parerythrobacter sp.]
MADVPPKTAPSVYSIAAHRGFADALVAGLADRYADPDVGLARLTLLVPSARARRTMTEAFVRLYGAKEGGAVGLLMPRMAVAGDLDLDEALGPLFDTAGSDTIPPAVDPTWRMLTLAKILLADTHGEAATGAALFRQAADMAATMDRLLAEEIAPDDLLGNRIIDIFTDQARHWQDAVRRFAHVQQHWLAELRARGQVDAATRRNALFRHAARIWRETPPAFPIVAAGVTSAAPALAALLKTVARLPQGAVVLPDLDLTMDAAEWDELGSAGGDPDQPFAKDDAVTHPQYHLKLLLNRMGIAREEVQQWHRKGIGAARSDRSHAISALFQPPLASRGWATLDGEKRRLSALRLLETENPEREAQAIALLIREAVAEPEKRVALVTSDRGLARRVVHHLRRWNIDADDSAGTPLSQSPAGRLFLLLAHCIKERAAPVSLLALLQHPLVQSGGDRGAWLAATRAMDLELRAPRPKPGLDPLDAIALQAGVADWWTGVKTTMEQLFALQVSEPLSGALDILTHTASELCGDAVWRREDGRTLANLIEDLREQATATGTTVAVADLHDIMRDLMEPVAVRPPYGGHPRVAIYGLLESRMTRADLVICAGLNEGSWPPTPSVDPLLAPPILRALGVPGADFRIGLAAHDLAGAMGAPEVVLSRAKRDASGPTLPSRFLLRVRALMGREQAEKQADTVTLALMDRLDATRSAAPYPRPEPMPNKEQRGRNISATALDRLRSDPYQFYASHILGLRELDSLDAEPTAAWIGTLAHKILQIWHEGGGREPIAAVAERKLAKLDAHPVMRVLRQPRLIAGLEWVTREIAADPTRVPTLFEEKGSLDMEGITITGTADRIDVLADGTLAIVDYKTGTPPTDAQVAGGFSLQLGTLGLIAQGGGFDGVKGVPAHFEYWSLAKTPGGGKDDFGFVRSPVVTPGGKAKALAPEDFLPTARNAVENAIERYITGNEPFTARLNPDALVYNSYDQLMRLEEWQGRETQDSEA